MYITITITLVSRAVIATISQRGWHLRLATIYLFTAADTTASFGVPGKAFLFYSYNDVVWTSSGNIIILLGIAIMFQRMDFMISCEYSH